MKKNFTSIIIFLSVIFFQNSFLQVLSVETSSASAAIKSSAVQSAQPKINITAPVSQGNESGKLIKVKTTIVTQKTETPESEPISDIKQEAIDAELPSDVDKILREMDIDDTDPLEEPPVNASSNPMKNNFFWIALVIILFPVILFILLIKAMQIAKTRFEKEEKEKGLSKEEKLLDDLEKEQKKTGKKRRSLSDILGSSKNKQVESEAFEDEFSHDDEDFEFMVEEVVLIEEDPEKMSKPATNPDVEHFAKESQPKPEVKQESEEDSKQDASIEEVDSEKEKQSSDKKSKSKKSQKTDKETQEMPSETENSVASESGVIDSFEVEEDLKFSLVKNGETYELKCNLKDKEILVMNLDKAQKFNKIRKIDSKPGRDVYMVKLDSWRGLVEVKEDSVKYLMDI